MYITLRNSYADEPILHDIHRLQPEGFRNALFAIESEIGTSIAARMSIEPVIFSKHTVKFC